MLVLQHFSLLLLLMLLLQAPNIGADLVDVGGLAGLIREREAR